MRNAWLVFLFFTFPLFAKAEYRVFRLVIKDKTAGSEREVLSTLDPFQYVGYFPIKPTESIDYVDTWRCFEDNSHFTEYCPSPRSRNAASVTPSNPK